MNSRTKNSIINSSVSITTQILIVVLNFVVKTIFIKTLGSEYLGINGLFSNIITMLSLADLGIGLAIPYSLYKPLATKDEKKIKGLMKYYSKIYTVIGIIVLVIGLSLIPILPYIIKDMPDISNIYLIYALFVIHSASSYFFIYKKFLIDSDQKGYISSRIVFAFSSILSIIQIVILILTKDFILFLVSSIIMVILQNIYISKKVDKMYPYIKEKNIEELTKEEIKDIKKNVSAVFLYKIGNVVTNGTDNIVISKFIGLISVGLYSNYILIASSITSIINQIFGAITSSIGNLVVTTNPERSRDIYEKLNFFNFYLYSLFSICIMVLINPFIKIWIGNDYLLSNIIVFIFGLKIYTSGMQNVTSSFRNAYGLFHKARFVPILMVILNIVLSVILVIPFGIAGVIGGTILSTLLTTAWLDPYIIYKNGFQKSPKEYYIKYVMYLIIYIVLSILASLLFSILSINNIFGFIVAGTLIFVIINLVLIIMFGRTKEFIYFYDKFIPSIKNKLKLN